MTKLVLPIHGDQHCPGGPDPLPCLASGGPWIRQVMNPADLDDTQLVSSGAWTLVKVGGDNGPFGTGATFDTFYGDDGETWFDDGLNNQIEVDLLPVGVAQQRRVYFSAQIRWKNPFAGDIGLRLASSQWGWHKQVYNKELGGAAGDAAGVTFLYWQYLMPSGTTTISLQARQDSGSNQHIADAFLEIGIVNAFTGQFNTL